MRSTTSNAGTWDWVAWMTVVVYTTVPSGNAAPLGGDTNGVCRRGCVTISDAGDATPSTVMPANVSWWTWLAAASAADAALATRPTACTVIDPPVPLADTVHKGTVTAAVPPTAVSCTASQEPQLDTTPLVADRCSSASGPDSATSGAKRSVSTASSNTPLSMRTTAMSNTCSLGTTYGRLPCVDVTATSKAGARTVNTGTTSGANVKFRLAAGDGIVPNDTTGCR